MTPEQLIAARQEFGRAGTAGLTQEAMADVLGVSRVTISRWETGASPIPTTVELAIAGIRRYRSDLAALGRSYPMMNDVLHVMRTEGIDQGAAIRRFGVQP